jgi:adenylate cyclase
LAALGDNGGVAPARLDRVPILFESMARVGRLRVQETLDMSLAGRDVLAVTRYPTEWGGVTFAAIADLGRQRTATLHRLLLLGLLLATSTLILLAGSDLLARRLVSRVGQLGWFVDRIKTGDYAARIDLPGGDELAALGTTFNEMAGKLEHRERMRRFVSDQVWDATKSAGNPADDAVARCDVAVLFSHLHRFDTLMKRESPTSLIALLNGYFSRLEPAIRHADGSIDKFIGDAVMAVFFSRPDADHPAIRAVAAAREMMAAQAELNEERIAAGLEALRTDIGIHFGPVVSGRVGSHDGRLDFTVIGDTVNTAARLCSAAAARPTAGIVVSAQVREHQPADLPCLALPALPLKGKTQPIATFVMTM